MRRRGPARRAGERAAAVDAYEVPLDAVRRFRAVHPEVDDDTVLSLVTAATRQWFRLLARDPAGGCALPSKAVADLWLEVARDEEPYARFCAEAFDGPMPFTGVPVMTDGVLADAAGLARTAAAARAVEPDAVGGLPVLFRVDAQVGVRDGRRYLATCGGGAECHPLPGSTCVAHLAGPTSRRPLLRRPPEATRASNQIPNPQVRGFTSGP